MLSLVGTIPGNMLIEQSLNYFDVNYGGYIISIEIN